MTLLTALFFAVQVFAAEPDLRQETLGYCNARASLTLSIVRATDDGTPVDNINIAFAQAPQNQEDAEAREWWIASLKNEIAEFLPQFPPGTPDRAERVAQKVIEKCWYDYGKRRLEKKVRFVPVASSERIGQSAHAACEDKLTDQIFIGNQLGSGNATAEELRNLANRSADQLGDARLSHILVLIAEADHANKKGELQKWFNGYLDECLK